MTFIGAVGLSEQKLSKENVHLGQCLEFSRDIIKIGQQFSITIKIGNGFNFDFRNIKEEEQNIIALLQKAAIIVAVLSFHLLLCGPPVFENKAIVALYNISELNKGRVPKKHGK